MTAENIGYAAANPRLYMEWENLSKLYNIVLLNENVYLRLMLYNGKRKYLAFEATAILAESKKS